jgi:hypothetical protein
LDACDDAFPGGSRQVVGGQTGPRAGHLKDRRVLNLLNKRAK